eukprot:6479375-Amphidinium_carterae.1
MWIVAYVAFSDSCAAVDPLVRAGNQMGGTHEQEPGGVDKHLPEGQPTGEAFPAVTAQQVQDEDLPDFDAESEVNEVKIDDGGLQGSVQEINLDVEDLTKEEIVDLELTAEKTQPTAAEPTERHVLPLQTKQTLQAPRPTQEESSAQHRDADPKGQTPNTDHAAANETGTSTQGLLTEPQKPTQLKEDPPLLSDKAKERIRQTEDNGRIHLGMALEGIVKDNAAMVEIVNSSALVVGAYNKKMSDFEHDLRGHLHKSVEQAWIELWRLVFAAKRRRESEISQLTKKFSGCSKWSTWHFETIELMSTAVIDLNTVWYEHKKLLNKGVARQFWDALLQGAFPKHEEAKQN